MVIMFIFTYKLQCVTIGQVMYSYTSDKCIVVAMQITITYTLYNGYLSSRLSQHCRVWTSHVGLHEQCVKVDFFPRQLISIGRGRWARGCMLIWAAPTVFSLHVALIQCYKCLLTN